MKGYVDVHFLPVTYFSKPDLISFQAKDNQGRYVSGINNKRPVKGRLLGNIINRMQVYNLFKHI